MIKDWIYLNSSVWSISKFDERCCFLYVHDNSDDFQIYFSTEEQCGRWGHTSRCFCVGVCVCLCLCSYSTYVRSYSKVCPGGPEMKEVLIILFCVVSGSAPWWRRWYLMVRGTLWSWKEKETEILWRSGGLNKPQRFTVYFFFYGSENVCLCLHLVTVWIWH